LILNLIDFDAEKAEPKKSAIINKKGKEI